MATVLCSTPLRTMPKMLANSFFRLLYSILHHQCKSNPKIPCFLVTHSILLVEIGLQRQLLKIGNGGIRWLSSKCALYGLPSTRKSFHYITCYFRIHIQTNLRRRQNTVRTLTCLSFTFASKWYCSIGKGLRLVAKSHLRMFWPTIVASKFSVNAVLPFLNRSCIGLLFNITASYKLVIAQSIHQ